MKTHPAAAVVFFLGLLITFGAVGGMEQPEQADYLLEQILVALVGLAMMWFATPALKGCRYDQH